MIDYFPQGDEDVGLEAIVAYWVEQEQGMLLCEH
jgi:hypothetical protein